MVGRRSDFQTIVWAAARYVISLPPQPALRIGSGPTPTPWKAVDLILRFLHGGCGPEVAAFRLMLARPGCVGTPQGYHGYDAHVVV